MTQKILYSQDFLPPKDDTLMLVQRYATDLRSDLERRDEAVKWARLAGATLREIADAAKLTPQGISKIVRRVLDNSVDKAHT